MSLPIAAGRRPWLAFALLCGLAASAPLRTRAEAGFLAPRVLERHEPACPGGGEAREVAIDLLVALDAAGAIQSIDPAGDLAPEDLPFLQASRDALSRWRFSAALRAGQPVPSRLRLGFRFAATPVEGPDAGVQPADASVVSAAEPTSSLAPDGGLAASPLPDAGQPSEPPRSSLPEAPPALLEATVTGRKRTPAAASVYEVSLGEFAVVPRKNAAAQLMTAPGVLTANHGGEGHAHETFMRGFAAREGQDIEFLVDGIPLNEVSNPHGHGYTDLHFLPPEVVRSVAVSEGPFDPVQGDFAFAGTADYRLGVEERGLSLTQAVGSFGAARTLLLWAPEGQSEDTFAGFEYFRTDGFGENRAAQRVAALGRYGSPETRSGLRWTLSLFGHAGRYDQPGVLREDDYQAGRVGFFDTYDPTQGGESARVLGVLSLRYGPAERRAQQSLYVGGRGMRLRTNFTGWVTDTEVLPGVPASLREQRGDGLEMRYSALTAGATGSYALRTLWLRRAGEVAVGYALRFDQGSSEQYRLRSVTAIPYRTVSDRDFSVLDAAAWLRVVARPVRALTLRGGLRLEAFSFGVVDLNLPAADREGARVDNQSSQAFGFALNPRLTVDYRLLGGLHAVVSAGQGTRSTEAASLSDNEGAPFALGRQAEAGLVWEHGRPGQGLAAKVQGSYCVTHIDRDMVFSETDGRNVPVGASLRQAILFGGRLHVGTWADALLNVGWAHATLDRTGELLPYIPELVVRADLAVKGSLPLAVLGHGFSGRVGLGFTFVPGRPLPYDTRGDDLYLVDLGGELHWHALTLGLSARNLLDLRYREAEFNYASNFSDPSLSGSRVPQRHFVAGEPLTVLVSLTVRLEQALGQARTAPASPTPHPPTEQEDEP